MSNISFSKFKRPLVQNFLSTKELSFSDDQKRGVFYDKYDEPTYAGFYVEFDFISGMITEENQNDLPCGLLGDPNNHHYSAETYLNNLGYPDKANNIKAFRTMLKDLCDKYPWNITSIGGLDEIYKLDTKLSNRINDKKITLTFDESIDMKITSMFDLYKKAAYDSVYMRHTLPDIMRSFNINIYVSEFRTFHQPIKDATNKRGNSSNFLEHLDSHLYVMKFELLNCEFIMDSLSPSWTKELKNTGDGMITFEASIKVGKIKEIASYPMIIEAMKYLSHRNFSDEHTSMPNYGEEYIKGKSFDVTPIANKIQGEHMNPNDVYNNNKYPEEGLYKKQNVYGKTLGQKLFEDMGVVGDLVKGKLEETAGEYIKGKYLGNVYGFSTSTLYNRLSANPLSIYGAIEDLVNKSYNPSDANIILNNVYSNIPKPSSEIKEGHQNIGLTETKPIITGRISNINLSDNGSNINGDVGNIGLIGNPSNINGNVGNIGLYSSNDTMEGNTGNIGLSGSNDTIEGNVGNIGLYSSNDTMEGNTGNIGLSGSNNTIEGNAGNIGLSGSNNTIEGNAGNIGLSGSNDTMEGSLSNIGLYNSGDSTDNNDVGNIGLNETKHIDAELNNIMLHESKPKRVDLGNIGLRKTTKIRNSINKVDLKSSEPKMEISKNIMFTENKQKDADLGNIGLSSIQIKNNNLGNINLKESKQNKEMPKKIIFNIDKVNDSNLGNINLKETQITNLPMGNVNLKEIESKKETPGNISFTDNTSKMEISKNINLKEFKPIISELGNVNLKESEVKMDIPKNVNLKGVESKETDLGNIEYEIDRKQESKLGNVNFKEDETQKFNNIGNVNYKEADKKEAEKINIGYKENKTTQIKPDSIKFNDNSTKLNTEENIILEGQDITAYPTEGNEIQNSSSKETRCKKINKKNE